MTDEVVGDDGPMAAVGGESARERGARVCPQCGGAGVVVFEDQPFPDRNAPWSMTVVDGCPVCIGQGRCPLCGEKLPDDGGVCGVCGYRVPELG